MFKNIQSRPLFRRMKTRFAGGQQINPQTINWPFSARNLGLFCQFEAYPGRIPRTPAAVPGQVTCQDLQSRTMCTIDTHMQWWVAKSGMCPGWNLFVTDFSPWLASGEVRALPKYCGWRCLLC